RWFCLDFGSSQATWSSQRERRNRFSRSVSARASIRPPTSSFSQLPYASLAILLPSARQDLFELVDNGVSGIIAELGDVHELRGREVARSRACASLARRRRDRIRGATAPRGDEHRPAGGDACRNLLERDVSTVHEQRERRATPR